jgi:hypothetical protein
METDEQDAALLEAFHDMSEAEQLAMLRTVQHFAAGKERAKSYEHVEIVYRMFKMAH